MASRLTKYLKPQPQEALMRIRNSGIAFSSFLVLIYLLDIKSLYLIRCWRVALGGDANPYGVGVIGWTVNVAELSILTLLFLNVLQSLYALKYPPPPPPPTPASSRKLVLTPQKTPTPGSRTLLGTSISPSSLSQSQSQPQLPFRSSMFSSLYPPSPLSTPTRSLAYSLPFPSSSTSLFDSASSSFSSSGMGWSPSKSPLLKYKGRKGGRALESSLLMDIMSENAQGDD